METKDRMGFRSIVSKTLALLAVTVLALAFSKPCYASAEGLAPSGEYVVQKGDCLYGIARKQLGDGSRWNEIYELNKGFIKDPAVIYSGQMLALPGAAPAVVPVVPAAAELPAVTPAPQVAASPSNEESEANLYALLVYAKAQASEPSVTALLKSMESDKAHLEGLDYRLKTLDSISRKILTNAHDMEVSPAEAAGTIKDALRFTYIIDDSDYTATTKKILDTLTARGYKVYSFKNYWTYGTASYEGLNTFIKDSAGTIFELQFHTPESFDVKQNKTHQDYEIVRSESATQAEKDAATKRMEALTGLVPVPVGAVELTYKTSD